MARPPKLDTPVRVNEDGTTTTAEQLVLERLRLGQEYESAAVGATVSKQTIWNWAKAGATARAKEAIGLPLTKEEDRYARFLDAKEEAEAQAELVRLGIILRVAEGGIPQERVTEKWLPDKETGELYLVERVVQREVTGPIWAAAAWWLERRMPQKYRKRYEMTGADGADLIPRDERARAVADSARDFLEAAAAGAEAAAKVNGNGAKKTHG